MISNLLFMILYCVVDLSFMYFSTEACFVKTDV